MAEGLDVVIQRTYDVSGHVSFWRCLDGFLGIEPSVAWSQAEGCCGLGVVTLDSP
jgi:hypothetical protein